jgi:sialate O-acetylesterase
VKFSAIGYGTALQLYKSTGIPVGIIDCSLGSSRVDAWTNPDIVNTEEYQALMPVKHEDYYLVKTNRDFWLYENKLLNVAPFVLNGVLWYQGESNRASEEAPSYGKQLKMMIENWREVFRDPKLAFYIVQLAPFYELPDRQPCDWAAIRAGQEWVSKTVPDTYLVTLRHTGEGKLIHPTRKQGTCTMLCRAVLNSKFGVDVEYSGPIAEKFEVIENGLKITFSHADGLHIRGEYLEDTFIRSRFYDHGQVVFPEIDGNVLILRYRPGFDGIRITMGYDNYCHHNLYNSAGYLASPFCFMLE